MSDLICDWCSYQAALHACKRWHYSKSMPVGKLVKIGFWENEKFIGCVIFGRGANPNLLSPFGLTQSQGCELTRVALRKHDTATSSILARAIKMLKTHCPGLKLVVSYADVDQGHSGTIYQATNWIYDGLHDKGTLAAFIIHGKKVHKKTIHSKGIPQTIADVRKYLDPDAKEFRTRGKHRYLMPLTKKMRKTLVVRAKPYPKS